MFLIVGRLFIPMLKATVSAKANSGLWQLAQETEESLESIFSLNNNLPSVIALYFSEESPMNEKPKKISKSNVISDR